MTPLIIDSELITLGQALKEIGVIDSGGAAKWFLAEEVVQVNGEHETRRGRKLYPGDIVTFANGQAVVVERQS